jgi:hypothetical protein
MLLCHRFWHLLSECAHQARRIPHAYFASLWNYVLFHRRDNFLPSPAPVKAAPAEHKEQHDDQKD